MRALTPPAPKAEDGQRAVDSAGVRKGRVEGFRCARQGRAEGCSALLPLCYLRRTVSSPGAWFHRRVAEALEARSLPAARIAPHWHEAGEGERAH
jgi:hypothetical protein